MEDFADKILKIMVEVNKAQQETQKMFDERLAFLRSSLTESRFAPREEELSYIRREINEIFAKYF
jgi:hypothetical protein